MKSKILTGFFLLLSLRAMSIEITPANKREGIEIISHIAFMSINNSYVLPLHPKIESNPISLDRFHLLDRKILEKGDNETCKYTVELSRYILKKSEKRIIQINYSKFIRSEKFSDVDCGDVETDQIDILNAKYEKDSDLIKQATFTRLKEWSKQMIQIKEGDVEEGSDIIVSEVDGVRLVGDDSFKFTFANKGSYSFFKESLVGEAGPKELSHEEENELISLFRGENRPNKRVLNIRYTNDAYGLDFQEYFKLESNDTNPYALKFKYFINDMFLIENKYETDGFMGATKKHR